MKKLLILAAVGEAATGLALVIVPSLVWRLLLGEELSGVAIPVARVLGIALIALGVACWPGTPLALIEYRYDVPFKLTGTIDELTFDFGRSS